MWLVRERRLVFGEAAELYDRARFGYSNSVVDDLLRSGGIDVEQARVVEVGAGTGKATVALASRGVEILALEPDVEMASVLRRNCAPFPKVGIETVYFEDWSQGSGHFDLVLSASAWHWVDPEIRYRKAAQTLSPHGTLALCWHRTAWRSERLYQELDALYRRVTPQLHSQHPAFPLSPMMDGQDWCDEIEASGYFHTLGPVFLADRLPTRAAPALDLDPGSGRARLSYRRAAALFQQHTGWTLHQLRHSALTHAAEDGTNLPLLLARSRDASVRSLERYARPGPEAVAPVPSLRLTPLVAAGRSLSTGPIAMGSSGPT
jgi:SAM-dependent methyltransferase